ncbi:unnamed protein product [Moneuplotes crassus]|uniref:B9 domain-containing protein 1 n=2 Tax=Euplotes crassus TaxID=5936 RepID=A0AAD1XVN2_EUPCR|nr:unnamed protein product [Moneuplotes crassus]
MERLEEDLSLGTSEEYKDDEKSIFSEDANIDNPHEYSKHENLQTYEPKRQPHSFFYLGVSGQIDSGEFNNRDGIAIKYDIVKGNRWKLVKGEETGISQHGFRNQGASKRIVWNFPFEVIYSSTNVKEWPQIVLYGSGKDFRGREVIEFYGSVHVPTAPGRHTRYVRLFQPVTSSIFGKFLGWIKGNPASYKDAPNLIAKGEGREVTRVQSGGLIKITFQITQRNLEKYGYKTTSSDD